MSAPNASQAKLLGFLQHVHQRWIGTALISFIPIWVDPFRFRHLVIVFTALLLMIDATSVVWVQFMK